ncbi:MAG: hypothetical protein ACTS6A_01485 [Candidatus Hodgkinia cicadicola]
MRLPMNGQLDLFGGLSDVGWPFQAFGKPKQGNLFEVVPPEAEELIPSFC